MSMGERSLPTLSMHALFLWFLSQRKGLLAQEFLSIEYGNLRTLQPEFVKKFCVILGPGRHFLTFEARKPSNRA